jgi:hypothetical protein
VAVPKQVQTNQDRIVQRGLTERVEHIETTRNERMIGGQRLEHKRTGAEGEEKELIARIDVGEKVDHDLINGGQLRVHTAGGIDEDAKGNRHRRRLLEPGNG